MRGGEDKEVVEKLSEPASSRSGRVEGLSISVCLFPLFFLRKLELELPWSRVGVRGSSVDLKCLVQLTEL